MFTHVFLFCIDNQNPLREHKKLCKYPKVAVTYGAAIFIFLQFKRPWLEQLLCRLGETGSICVGPVGAIGQPMHYVSMKKSQGKLSPGNCLPCPLLAHFLRRLTGLDPTLANFLSLALLHAVPGVCSHIWLTHQTPTTRKLEPLRGPAY